MNPFLPYDDHEFLLAEARAPGFDDNRLLGRSGGGCRGRWSMGARAAHLPILLSILAAPAAAQSDGWHQYNGPDSTRTSAGDLGLVDWPEGGPPVVWKTPTELGFSSFVVAEGRAFTLVLGDSREVCVALDVEDGKELWATPIAKAEYDRGGGSGAPDNSGGDGPRSTPSHDGDHVYVLGAGLYLYCLMEDTGEKVWSRDIARDYDGRVIRWQNAASPLIEGDLVLVAGGGKGHSLLAFHKLTGELAWSRGDEMMTHATPIAATLHGARQVIFYVQSGLVAVAPDSGEELWRIEYPYRTSSAASPVVHGNVVYCSAGYGIGAGAFEIAKRGDSFESKLLWRKRNDLMNHWSTPVCSDGYLYGMFSFKKYGEGPMMCVELATGEVQWSTDGFGPGNCILVGGTLVVLSDAGEVVLAEATPEAYSERARARVLDGKCWSTPTYSDGQVYVRSTQEGARLDLSAREPQR
jgi:outer membrane protein assembly factor BamB